MKVWFFAVQGSFGKAFGRGRHKGASDQSLSGAGQDGTPPVPPPNPLNSAKRSHSMELTTTAMWLQTIAKL